MIDWSKLETYEGHKYRSFEELCYQIAKGLYEERGRFTSIDDSGGGDGVEFYMTLPNGDQWGWQAKFYPPDSRLSEKSRKQSIKGSLTKACQKHRHLKKWFLCILSNFTSQEQDWFENKLRQSIPHDMGVKLEHWGKSDFNAWLSEPRFAGKHRYFFGELELDMNWFEKQFDKQKASVAEKFRSSLHTESTVDACIHALLGDKKFVSQISEWIEKTNEELSKLKDAINNLKGPTPNDIQWAEEEKCKVIRSAESLQAGLVHTIAQLEQAKKLLNEKRLSEAQAIDWESVLNQFREALKTHRTVGNEHGTSKIRYTGKEENELRSINEVTSTVHYPGSLIANLLDDFLHYAIKRCKFTNQSELNILGDAGVGKTHIACDICDERLNIGLPALFIRGIRFTSDRSIEEQLRGILDLPPSYRWNDFLQVLSAAAEAYHTRIPLIIDGLNESTHNGAFSNVWRLHLKGLIQEIAQTKNLVLITTCRTSFTEDIWETENPPNSVYSFGFDTDEELEEAVIKYFNEYKIKADLTAAPLEQFRHPIYLKIFCESKNRERNIEKNIYVGEQTLFQVFDEYLNQCNRAVCDHLGLHPNTPLLNPALNKMAEYMWQHRTRDIPLENLVHIVDDQSLKELKWSSSKTHAIVSEGVLVCRDRIEGGDTLHFTYDLLGGYLIAQYLIQHAAAKGQGFLHRAVSELFSEELQALHPLLGGIIKCLTTLLPAKIGRFLHNLSVNKTSHPLKSDISRCLAALLPATAGQFLHNFSDKETALDISVRGLFEIAPQDISEDCIDLITHLFENPRKREWLLELAETTVGHTNHPLNASFWSARLLVLPMPERDLTWTEYVRRNTERFEKILERFETSCNSTQQSNHINKERLDLLAEYIMWLLTSTVRPLRDKATRALYWYGRRFPQRFFKLVTKSLAINDPYIPERMLAATYGIAMARQYEFGDVRFANRGLRLYGRRLYENMFKPSAPYSTTHVLARDYARRTIDIALIHHPGLLTDDERKHITPPFTNGGIREWGESEDKNAGEYQKGPDPLQVDFANYTLGHLVKGRGNYNCEHPEYKRVRANVLWRIYDLGYSLDHFGEIDTRINQGNQVYGRSKNGGKTDRYGKKYSWIAFFELVGFRQDEKLLPDYFDDARISDADIDPSFPAEPQEYNLVTKDFLGNRRIPNKEWMSKSLVPDLIPYLKVNQLCGEEGCWILLQGYLRQEDNQARREILAFVQGQIVKAEQYEEIIEGLKQKKINAHAAQSCPEDYYTYAGEIPWCDTYPPNCWEEVSCEFGVETDSVEQSKSHACEILAPLRENNWESYHSAIIAGRNIATPSRQIAETLGLCGQPQSFNLFEEDGRCASLTFRYGHKLTDTQTFTYLREDLLKRYLEDIDGELIWVIWGEQCLISQDQDTSIKPFEELKEFEEVMAYRDLSAYLQNDHQ